MHDMWKRIKSVLKEHSFTDLVEGKEYSDISEDRIRNAMSKERGRWFGLYYDQEPAVLGVEAAGGYGFIVGVLCKNKEEYHEIQDRLKKLESKIGRGENPADGWPWWCVLRRDGTGLQPDDIKILADEKEREKLTEDIAKSAAEKLSIIRDEFKPANS